MSENETNSQAISNNIDERINIDDNNNNHTRINRNSSIDNPNNRLLFYNQHKRETSHRYILLFNA